MGADEIEEISDNIELIGGGITERVPQNGSLSGRFNKMVSRRKVKISSKEQNEEENECAQITLDIPGDSAVSVEPLAGNNDRGEDGKLDLLSKRIEKKRSHLKQVSKELKRKVGTEKKKYDRTTSAASNALKGLNFITKAARDDGWEKVYGEFYRLTKKTNRLLPRSMFAECIDELLNVISKRREIDGDPLNEAELKEIWEAISDDRYDTRLKTFFDMIDKDADGRITEDEIKQIIILCAGTNRLASIENHAGQYAALIMEELDPDGLRFITLDQLEMLLLHGSTNFTTLDSKDLNKMLSSIKPKPRYEGGVGKRCMDTIYFLPDSWKRNWILVLWIGVMLGLFAYKFVQYRRKAAYEVMGHCVCMAKGAAETLKLNMALILLPVCRNTVTWLRSKTKLGIVVPFNDNLNFHKVIAVAVAIGVGIHAIYHLACDFPRLLHANSEKYKLMEPFFGKQATNYWHFVKSWEGVTGIIMVVLMAIAFTTASPWLRKRKVEEPKTPNCLQPLLNSVTGFNVFWYTHHLFVFVYALLIVHGFKLYFTKEWYKKTTWMYLAIPVTIYALERLTRILRPRIKSVKILQAVVYKKDLNSRGDVLGLRVSKPEGFRYKSGQYMFVKCANVSPFEWHPFSITSAPGDDYLSVHIKENGDWTNSLIKEFSKSKCCLRSIHGQSELLMDEHNSSSTPLPKVLVDGPYGAPAQDYKKYEVVLLVGLGIGATPMISIVKDILNNIKAKEEEERITNMEEGTIGKSSRPSEHKKTDLSNFKTRKAYFYWMAGEQGFFDWFKGVINEVAEEDHKKVIEIHSHLTSVYEDGDARSALVTVLQSLNHAKEGLDILNGTPIASYFARPNWRSVYNRIANNHPQKRIGVFYCGAPAPIKELRGLALEFSQERAPKFDFHKENF
ncbi:respiratory burst oxidase homolog protein D isoform X2 [Medicago truncatula]|uniref:Respiratory burst oxidase-like protein D n=1 Tax=Medicago truncatula TaxID=3880 RepID=A0A072V2T7_MEDTR|nr:respiratory burst oxidase homolog protein D isoform X2 [Medicago truncatula]KEH35678.1 respiratory burst oxidase-like protein D [Medicago truncatula]